jgi:hypothetical protein
MINSCHDQQEGIVSLLEIQIQIFKNRPIWGVDPVFPIFKRGHPLIGVTPTDAYTKFCGRVYGNRCSQYHPMS